jgi:2,3-bisphosphoglycerate-dependent phosphoglycerate mutase
MNRSAQICVARHGETDWNTAGILQGWLDTQLNERGRQQARDLAAALAEFGFTSVCSSPLSRALESAQIIAERLRLPPPLLHDGLKERNFGVIQGIPKAELAELNPLLLEQIVIRNPAAIFEQGESMDDCASRVLGALMDIAGQHAGERILVITHGWAMDVVARHARDLPRTAILHVKPKNGECLWLEATAQTIRRLPGDFPDHPLTAPRRRPLHSA